MTPDSFIAIYNSPYSGITVNWWINEGIVFIYRWCGSHREALEKAEFFSLGRVEVVDFLEE